MSQKRGMAGQVGHAKKAKNEDDEDTPTFEDHLAGLDDEDWGDDAPMEGMLVTCKSEDQTQLMLRRGSGAGNDESQLAKTHTAHS